MKIDLFENKYKTSNGLKIFFADLVCFLLVAIISIGFCYAYFSDRADVKGNASMALVAIEYQHKIGNDYVAANNVYAIINATEQSTIENAVEMTGKTITPGTKITIVGRALNKSTVSVFVLAKLEFEVQKFGSNTSTKQTIWFNIGTNDPGEGEAQTPGANKNPLQLSIGDNGLYTVGASSIAASTYKDLFVSYTFDGDSYENGDVIKNVGFTLAVHQRDYLDSASDWENYSSVTTNSVTYSQASIYAAHHITGNLVNAN